MDDTTPNTHTDETAPESTQQTDAKANERKRLRPNAGTTDDGRGKRLFGVLMGTLNRNKKEAELPKSEAERKREDLEKRLREKLEAEKLRLREEVEKEQAVKAKALAEKREAETQQRKTQAAATLSKHAKNTAHFVKTVTEPPVLFLPAGKPNERIRKILEDQLKAVKVPAAAVDAMETEPAQSPKQPDEADKSNVNDKEVAADSEMNETAPIIAA
ncbi:pinin/SDK/memA/ protein conserved region-domain-containing protein [Chytriomyces cf. hyalinus JEL632]|nr:pinin/SDK/memA/ protein conserved region-domain-containing protein [Chytriomyces cf. hyalinus JEL632]